MNAGRKKEKRINERKRRQRERPCSATIRGIRRKKKKKKEIKE